MNVITVVSCKAGTGKSTLTNDLAAYTFRDRRRCLIIDADPNRGLARLNARRAGGALPFATVRPVLDRQLQAAETLGYDWVLIDTGPEVSDVVREAVRAATMLLIPARLSLLNLIAVSQTIDLVGGSGRPYAVVLNGAQPCCGESDAQAIADWRAWLARCDIPVWQGQISERPGFVPGTDEAGVRVRAATEIGQLWSLIDRAVAAIGAAPVPASEEKRAA
jgi:chromosome partitioning protein